LYSWRNCIQRLILTIFTILMIEIIPLNWIIAVSQEASTSDVMWITDISIYNTGPSGTEVAWETNIAASSQVFWDTCAHDDEYDYASSTPLNTKAAFHHRQLITGLISSSTYHYRVKSTFSLGENQATAVSPDHTFTTLPSSTLSTFTLIEGISPLGVFSNRVEALSADGRARVSIEPGVRGLTMQGIPLTEIGLALLENPPGSPLDSRSVSLTYELSPPGAVFDQPVEITLSFFPADLNGSVANPEIFIAWWDISTGQWITLPSSIDNINKTVTARVDHFIPFMAFESTRYQTQMKTEANTTPQISSTALKYTGPSTASSAIPLDRLLLWIFFFLAAINLGLGLFALIYIRHRKKGN